MTRSQGHPGYPPPRAAPRDGDPRQGNTGQLDAWGQPIAPAASPATQPHHGGRGYEPPRNAGYAQQHPYPGYPEADPYAQQGWPADPHAQQWGPTEAPAPVWPAATSSDPLTNTGYHYPASYESPHAAAPPGLSPLSTYPPQVDPYGQQGRARAPAVPPSGGPSLGAGQPAHVPVDLRGAMFEDWREDARSADRARATAANGYSGQPGYPADPYAHGGFAQPGYGQDPQQAQTYAGYGQLPPQSSAVHGYAQDWSQGDAYGAQHAPPQHGGYAGAQGYGEAAGYQDPGYGTAQGHAQGHAMAAVNQDYDDDYEDDDAPEEPRRSSRMLLIVGALVSAIVVGGGLAYGYKILVGPDPRVAGGAPVVRGAADPTKVRPSDPGGRKFEHADSKILGRLGGQAQASEDPNGAKRVPTMVVGRDGSIQVAPEPQAPALPSPSNPVVSVPGLTVVDAFAGRRAAAQAPASGAPIVVTPPAQQQPAPQAPVVLARSSASFDPSEERAPEPATTRSNVAAAAPPAARITPPPAATRPAPRVEARAPAAAASPAATSSPPAEVSAGGGYVVVLASVPVSTTSRIDALKQYADMQQRYGSLLSSRAPEVREANLGEKGKYHRLLVGPPASRTSANELCANLKGAGYPGCWITTY
ncbi:MAG: SPOR domain-containing protein [Hyphomicrobiaceae bacterium]|nr:SPOR domain-containing protein [Hyphomicrobiaceae bacterium]